jgi:hypothetical protein
LLSVEEYAKSTNETESEVKKRVDIAKLMVEFLEFINAPGQFYIARDLQLYFPLEELLKLIKKCHTAEEINDLKLSVFTNILMQTAGDMTRFVRNIKAIIGSDYQDDFLVEQKALAKTVVGTLPPKGKMNTNVIREIIRANDEVTHALERSMDKALTQVRRNETKNRPIQLVEKATVFLEGIDTNIISKMNDSELKRLSRQLDRLQQTISQIKEHL